MKKVFIVEDDLLIANLEKDYLEVAGYDVYVSNEAYDGLQQIRKIKPDFIILDLMLPGIDGFELCRRIREDMNIPVMIVTAKKADVDKVKALGLGANDYLVKPFSPSELVARVKAHLNYYESIISESSDSIADTIKFNDLKIVHSARKVYLKEQEVELVNKEYELLKYLAENPNMVFSRDTLFDSIWGMDAIGDTSTVTVHIKRLRDKIEDDPSNPKYIETVYGAGYRLNVDPR